MFLLGAAFVVGFGVLSVYLGPVIGWFWSVVIFLVCCGDPIAEGWGWLRNPQRPEFSIKKLRPKSKIEVSTDRLRVLDTSRADHGRPQWIDYPRSEIDSVTLQNGQLTISARSGRPLLQRQIDKKTKKLRRALERHYWC